MYRHACVQLVVILITHGSRKLYARLQHCRVSRYETMRQCAAFPCNNAVGNVKRRICTNCYEHAAVTESTQSKTSVATLSIQILWNQLATTQGKEMTIACWD